MTARQIAIAATSCGYAAQSIGGGEAKAQISIDAQEIGFGDYNRGIEVAVFDETTGQLLSCTAFDTLIGNSEVFANFIDRLPAGRIVAIAVKGDAIGQTPLSYRAKQALKSLGSAQIDRLQAYQSYTLIGIKGRSPGAARESLAWLETSSSYTFRVEAVREGEMLAVEAISTPSRVEAPQHIPQGGHAAITLNGNLLIPDGGYQSGWNLGVFDPQNGQVKTSGCFNPWNPADIDRFVQTLADLQAGEIVAIATQNYAGGEVDERVKNACTSIGSTAIGQLKYGGSWAIVGERGAAPGQAIENLDNISQYYSQYGAQGVRVKAWIAARPKSVGLASIIVAGDVDILPPTVGSLGKTIDKNNIKFFTTILGNGHRVLVQQTANFSPSATLENMG
ncbi:MAG: interleukin-like EMT inducer domain-containing protein, partial [Cyanobacteriota bacterium]|nr:interleukin-like EMT inducer domain-containing protein [Cyanobacteriota bacterium]